MPDLAPPPLVARRVQTTWLYTLGSIVFFIIVFQANLLLLSLTLLRTATDAGEIARGVAMILLVLLASAVQIRFCWFLHAGLGGGIPSRGWSLLLWLPAAAVWVLGLTIPGLELFTACPLLLSVSVAAPLLRRKARGVMIGAGLALAALPPIIVGGVLGREQHAELGTATTFLLIYCALLPVMVLFSVWWWQIVVELDRHRRASADLAVAQERLRFASDLHDIQGHHLQVIALKSELAERLIGSDPEAARGHIHETRVIARQALEETRSLVYGYRQVALAEELENAREVLSAAGARCELVVDELCLGEMPDDAEVRRALALVVREATTNILRHSDARQAWIRLGAARGGVELVIGNDEAYPPSSGAGDGTGLAGLRARMLAVGGALTEQSGARPGVFELTAWAPELEPAR